MTTCLCELGEATEHLRITRRTLLALAAEPEVRIAHAQPAPGLGGHPGLSADSDRLGRLRPSPAGLRSVRATGPGRCAQRHQEHPRQGRAAVGAGAHAGQTARSWWTTAPPTVRPASLPSSAAWWSRNRGAGSAPPAAPGCCPGASAARYSDEASLMCQGRSWAVGRLSAPTRSAYVGLSAPGTGPR